MDVLKTSESVHSCEVNRPQCSVTLQGGRRDGMGRFSKEQEDALQLLSSLQQLHFSGFQKLQQLPAGLCNLTSLKELMIYDCPAISSLPNDGLPKSLQKLWVSNCGNQELIEQCRGLKDKALEFHATCL